ncbi:unnamed protein product [Sphenostylis stenocarpa]|uniref:Uncharacterized protein n=1 Tax=Sphenostylis stenocarpa TaxID=92480 RepID=A0AA86S7C1_9FABA|nr:unnamed protein product [Sphenostylis stenocarpa]
MLERNSSVHRQFVTPRRSPRFLPQQNNTTPNPKSAKHTVSKKESNEFTVGPRRSSRLNNGDVGFSSLRRSPRFNNESSSKKVKNTSVKGGDAETKENCVVSDEGFGEGRKKERKEKRAEVKKQKNHVVSDEGIGGGAKKGVMGRRLKLKLPEMVSFRMGVLVEEDIRVEMERSLKLKQKKIVLFVIRVLMEKERRLKMETRKSAKAMKLGKGGRRNKI